MSSKSNIKGYKLTQFKEQLRLLKVSFNVYTNKELAEVLGITESAIKQWKKRDSIPMKYMKMIENKEQILNNYINNVSQKGTNSKQNVNLNIGHGNLNEIDLKLCELIKKLSDKEKEYYYHEIKSQILKKQL